MDTSSVSSCKAAKRVVKELPNAKLREILPTRFALVALMHCYGMHIDANFETSVIVIVICTLNFSYHFRNLEDASGGYGDMGGSYAPGCVHVIVQYFILLCVLSLNSAVSNASITYYTE